MKIKFNTNLIINIIIIGYTIFLVINAVYTSYSDPFARKGNGIVDNTENNLKPIYPYISDSLSYRQYTKLKDSISKLRRYKNGNYNIGGTPVLGGLVSTS